jgi:molybdenum cofactor guanylyltransferase
MTMGDVSALILAGGRATRFGGVAKHTIIVNGTTILERQAAVLAPRVAEIIVSSALPIAGYRTVADAIPDGGPLAGIAAGLAAATTPWLLIVAGDMPYLDPAVLDLLLDPSLRDREAVAFEVGGLPEPLLCVVQREPTALRLGLLLARGQRKASRLLTDSGLQVHWIAERELRQLDPMLRSLKNINEPADLGES